MSKTGKLDNIEPLPFPPKEKCFLCVDTGEIKAWGFPAPCPVCRRRDFDIFAADKRAKEAGQ